MITDYEFISKIEKVSEVYARNKRKNDEMKRQKNKVRMMKIIQNDYENLDEEDLVYCFKRMAEF